ncbi:MAG: hypothetical protein QNJ04_12410 [Desulfobacterales bacterium]|nr:hypothetical protein [Desulfobacterales bacterium]
MNNRQRRILAQQIGQNIDSHQRRVISIPLTSAMLEMDEAHLQRLEREGLFPVQILRNDGTRGYELRAVYRWLKDYSDGSR